MKLLISLIIVLLSMLGCFHIPCSNTILESKNIEGTKFKIVIFERDCGATTGTGINVSIIRQDAELPNDGGNIFIADTDHGKAPSIVGTEPELKVSIVENQVIEITYNRILRVFKNKTEFKDFIINYTMVNPD